MDAFREAFQPNWPKSWSPANTSIHLMAVTQESVQSNCPAGGIWEGEGGGVLGTACGKANRNSPELTQLQTCINRRGAQGMCKVLSGQYFISVSEVFGATKTPQVLNM